VRSIFLYQPSEASSLATMTERGRGFECLDRSEQSALVQMAWLYGQWLRQEAEQRGLPTLSAMPQDTVLERAIAVAGR
jgi:hypothetical protein